VTEASLAARTDEARRRSGSYWLLAGLFLEPPTEAGLSRLAESLAGVSADSDDAVGDALVRLRNAVAIDAPDVLAVRLAPEHLRLTGGLKAGFGPRPPYESVYREGGVMGERTMGVLKAYQDAGLDPLETAAVPGDHLGIELKFLALACYREADAWGAGDTEAAADWIAREARFLEGHLATWVDAYCAEMRNHARDPYYVAVADLAEAACRLDLARVRQLAEYSAAA